jgi:hypothetical protein
MAQFGQLHAAIVIFARSIAAAKAKMIPNLTLIIEFCL